MAQQETFKFKKDVHRWLTENGYQIGQSQFYEHCRLGLLRPAPKSKEYTLAAIQKYADLHVRRADTGEKQTAREQKMQEEKLELQLKREKLGYAREEFEFAAKQKKFIPRAEHELAVVSRAVAFMAHLNHSVQENVAVWIQLVGGDQSKAPALVEAMTEEIERRMGDFATDAEFDVIMEAE